MSWSEHVRDHEEVGSTMDVARELGFAGAVEGTTVVARSQTRGRGRRGRAWHSPPGAGLWLTTLLRPPPERSASELSIVAGVALLDAVVALGATEVRLKWPNDLVVGERKLAGVLLEAELLATPRAFVLVGMGVNLAPARALALPEDIAERYVGLVDRLAALSDREALRARLLGQILMGLEQHYHTWRRCGLAVASRRWEAADALRDCRVRAEIAGRLVEGVASGLGEGGGLRVTTATGIATVSAGEVERLRHV